ncbi:unnamed protein product (macronuclear) [Paramecium tetraurelia]|uniref:Uncharacterized protein n=1 Tax=Paramecium tetraurelia TaxID=5888 RepID=A0C9F1_PARTE|nr:uncharacterized protein GSPATT00006724001 [Paramecium tetraurelia]CAK67418.1 unnamed protein product [Paramecium tetraurelia]|eukprot:XP_001434815.1 hypothetical protein (macronuclear) [Paramecium tetraurelia strain d4-2]
MILCETRRRQRRMAVHAETEEEYLQKLTKQDESRQRLTEHQQPSPQLEGFIINHDFSFDPFGSEPIFLLQKTTIYKSHFLLLICEDFSMNLKRLQSILDSCKLNLIKLSRDFRQSNRQHHRRIDIIKQYHFKIRLLCSHNYLWKCNPQIPYLDTQSLKSLRNFQRIVLSFIQCIRCCCQQRKQQQINFILGRIYKNALIQLSSLISHNFGL